MAKPISNIPILLLPLKLETRFVKDELWIRAFPDEAFLQSHNPNLSNEEISDAKAFRQHSSDEQKRLAWEELVSKYGVYRSSWIVQISSEDIEIQKDNEKAKEVEPSFYFKWLPDRLVFYIYKQGDQEPSYKGDGSVIDREGLTVLGEGDEWLQDFDQALKAGMGIKIKIDPADTLFERIIVSGFRHDDDPLIPANGLADLFDNHKYTEGFSFLKYGTPTNNTEKATSGHSARDEFEVANSYVYAVEGLNLDANTNDQDNQTKTNGELLAQSLGFETEQLKHVRLADEKPPELNELFQRASWFALGAQPLFMLFGNQISSEIHEELWQHYSTFVKSRGQFSALKIGRQPYGILPVMNISNIFLPENKDRRESENLFDRMTVILALLMRRWLSMAESSDNQVPRLHGDDSYEDILKILSMQEGSSNHRIRALEYSFFRSKLYDLLQNRPENISQLEHLKLLDEDFKIVRETITSLANLLDLDNTGLTEDIDRFFRAPLLSFTEGNVNLIGFQDEQSVLVDDQGNKIDTESNEDTVISFTQEDLSSFQDFINRIKNQKHNELIQYTGDLTLFTDLFFRSYTNSCQLYNREIFFDLEIAQTSSAQQFKVGTILKEEGTNVKKGESILVIQDDNGNSIDIKAPFDGKVKRMLIKESEPEEITTGTLLFSLINEEKYNKIKNDFIDLGQQLIAANNAITDVKDRSKAQKKAISEVIDLNSYRLDAWITSLASRRLAEMREKSKYKHGIYFGAYGWIDGLEKDQTAVKTDALTDVYREKGGIIHAPGTAQSVAATVFKNSFLSHEQEVQSNPFSINLSSDRLQKSQILLDGIRQGQQLEALLGYQLERHLHDQNLHQEIYFLREAFPLHQNTTTNDTGFVNLSVIDGIKAIKGKEDLPNNIPPQNKVQVKKQIEKLEDTMDASLDTLFFETGYQVTQGNLSQAAAALEATKGEMAPPKIESLKTRIPGTGISHKLVMIFPPPEEIFTLNNPRAFTEPNLERWLQVSIGPMNKLGCVVELYAIDDERLIDTVAVTLDDLNITYLDFMYMSEDPVSDGASELELRIRNSAIEKNETELEDIKYVITTDNSESGPSLMKALEVVRYAKAFVSKCRYLKSEDLAMEDETVRYDKKALDNIKDNRLLPLIKRLKDNITSGLTEKSTLAFLSALEFETAKTAFLENTNVNVAELKTAIEKKVVLAEELLSKYNEQLPYYRAFEYLQQVAKTLFGDSFILIPPAKGSENFNRTFSDKKQHLLVGDASDNVASQVWGQERVLNWIQGVAQVHENAELFEDWSLVRTVWEQTMGLSNKQKYTIIQGPTLSQYPWVALSKKEIDQLLETKYTSDPVYEDPNSGETFPLSEERYYPDNCSSTVIATPGDITLEQTVFGLLVEEFSEHIPDKKVNTALSFNYNTPNNEPPQSLLLAIHPKAGLDSEFFWSEEDLRDILYDTMDLYKIRMVDLEAIEEYGYILPMTYWFNIPAHK